MDQIVQKLREYSTYNDKGEEIPDPRPVALPVGITTPVPLGDRIRQLVLNEIVKRDLHAAGIETFDEADDFDVPDEPIDRMTPFEETFDPLHTTAREQELRAGFVEERPAAAVQQARARITRTLDQAKATKKPEPGKATA